MKEKVILLIYNKGGHKSEMQRLLYNLNTNCIAFSNVKLISISENNDYLNNVHIYYKVPNIRDKYSNFMTFINLLTKTYKTMLILRRIKIKYNVRLILSTGAGISIIPIIFFKFFNTKTIHIESDCRFHTKSLSGKILHILVDKFYVPNKSLLQLYKKSEYSGQL